MSKYIIVTFYVTQKNQFRILFITIFSYSVSTLHIFSMLIFFVVVLETNKLLIHLLLTCLVFTEAVAKKELPKKDSCYLGLIIVKRLRGAHILVKLWAYF